jgi:hypothetical protein
MTERKAVTRAELADDEAAAMLARPSIIGAVRKVVNVGSIIAINVSGLEPVS